MPTKVQAVENEVFRAIGLAFDQVVALYRVTGPLYTGGCFVISERSSNLKLLSVAVGDPPNQGSTTDLILADQKVSWLAGCPDMETTWRKTDSSGFDREMVGAIAVAGLVLGFHGLPTGCFNEAVALQAAWLLWGNDIYLQLASYAKQSGNIIFFSLHPDLG